MTKLTSLRCREVSHVSYVSFDRLDHERGAFCARVAATAFVRVLHQDDAVTRLIGFVAFWFAGSCLLGVSIFPLNVAISLAIYAVCVAVDVDPTAGSILSGIVLSGLIVNLTSGCSDEPGLPLDGQPYAA